MFTSNSFTNTSDKVGSFAKAARKQASFGTTWNGADAYTSTMSKCLDLFGRSGAMRFASTEDKQDMFRKAYVENADAAMKLLFFTRDIRGGYGERDTFTDMLKWVADNHPESVEKNLWAVLEYGRGKDLYSLIGTKAEEAMWQFMKSQFELDLKNMNAGKSVSLLAKWIATPDASSSTTKALGKKTERMLGYNAKHERDYKKALKALRRYIDIPEAKMSTGRWSEIEYSKVASQCLIKHRNAFKLHDGERYDEFVSKASTGEVKMNTAAMTPCDIIRTVADNYTSDLDVMWKNLEDYVDGNVMVMADTSGSMTCHSYNQMAPIDVAIALSIYFAERNKGDLKDLFMTFASRPRFVEISGANLFEKYNKIRHMSLIDDTNLEAAFELMLRTCVNNNIPANEMPKALVVVSDMQINSMVTNRMVDGTRFAFHEAMKRRYQEAGYEMPHVIYWNVNAQNATFHASHDEAGASLVSGYSPAIFKTVMENIGKTPMDVMLEVLNSERYADVIA